jgi:hypothetical protein
MLQECLLTNVDDLDQPTKLRHGTLKNTIAVFGATSNTIAAIWKRALQSKQEGNILADMSARKKGRVGRKKGMIDMDTLHAISLANCKNLRSLATHLGVIVI